MNVLSSPRTNTDILHSPAKSPIEHFLMAFGVGVPFLGLILAIILLWGRGVGWLELSLMVFFYSFTILGITIGFHRMFTHRALQSGPTMRFILGVAGSMAAQGPLLEWCAIHRQHHKHSDRDGDPHSPHLHGEGLIEMLKGMFHSHFGWLFVKDPDGVLTAAPDLVKDPILCFVDRFFWFWMLAGWAVPALIAYAITGTALGAFNGFLWGGLVRTSLLHHVTWSINSVCHLWGTRPFDGPDHSRNNPIFGVLAFGEGWHNNHHAFPTSARHGLRWYQLDLTWLTILVLRAFGLVWNVRTVPTSAIEARTGSSSSFQGEAWSDGEDSRNQNAKILTNSAA